MPDITVGCASELSSLVRRITAPNAGPLTGPGTNTYLVGVGQVAVIDPGPADDSHVAAIIQEVDSTGGQIKWILVTHTHADHSPAAAVLAEKTGASLIGACCDDGFQDSSFKVSTPVQHHERLETDEFTLQAIHTPGHVVNHFCYLLAGENMLFTGDHIMEGSTVVIVPPQGSMIDYMASLALLKGYAIESMAPGHGKLITDPGEWLDFLIQHRLEREAKVAACLSKTGKIHLEALTKVVYDDVEESLHRIASVSLWAHLIKLEIEGLAGSSSPQEGAFGEQLWWPISGDNNA